MARLLRIEMGGGLCARSHGRDRREDIFFDDDDCQLWLNIRDTIADTQEAMAEACATGDYTMQEIPICFGVHYSTVSRAIKRAE